MRNILLAAVAVFGLSTGAAFAGEGNVDAFSFRAPGITTVIAPSYKRLPSTIGTPFPFNIAGQQIPEPVTAMVLPQDGSESILQTVGSLPRGFENGTVALTQSQSEQRSAIAHAAAQHGAAPASRTNG